MNDDLFGIRRFAMSLPQGPTVATPGNSNMTDTACATTPDAFIGEIVPECQS